MNTDTAILLLLAEQQRTIEQLRFRVAELEAQSADAGPDGVTTA